MPTIVLRRLSGTDEPEFIRAYRAAIPDSANFLHYYEDGMPLARYLEVLDERDRGLNLPPGHVPSTFLFAFDGPTIVGRVAIRHSLTESLRLVGGHIGYVVVPAYRRRGYATAMLGLAVQYAHETLGLERVLVTCDDDNVGSIKAIERNGGVRDEAVGVPNVRRYWFSK